MTATTRPTLGRVALWHRRVYFSGLVIGLALSVKEGHAHASRALQKEVAVTREHDLHTRGTKGLDDNGKLASSSSSLKLLARVESKTKRHDRQRERVVI